MVPSSTFVLCDVFAERPFAGNPLAVFLDADGVSDDTMASLAREFGWSEITFVSSRTSGDGMRVRIWTPGGELPFAGHPTIGTAVVLAWRRRIDQGWSSLELGIGPVAVDVTELDSGGGRATMVQRAPHFGVTYGDRLRLAGALGLQEDDVLDDPPPQMVSTGSAHFLVPIRSLEALGQARAAPDRLPGVLAEVGSRWAYLFCVDTPQSVSAARARLLCVGMEDAATGSAAGPLGAYLVHYGLHRPGALDIEQGIEMGRPSLINVHVTREEGEIEPVRVSGRAWIWGTGNLEP